MHVSSWTLGLTRLNRRISYLKSMNKAISILIGDKFHYKYLAHPDGSKSRLYSGSRSTNSEVDCMVSICRLLDIDISIFLKDGPELYSHQYRQTRVLWLG